MFFLGRFAVCFNLFVLHFLITPCLVVAVQLCMELIAINIYYIYIYICAGEKIWYGSMVRKSKSSLWKVRDTENIYKTLVRVKQREMDFGS